MTLHHRVSRAVVLGIAGACLFAVYATATQPEPPTADQNALRSTVFDRMPLLFVSEQVSPDGAMGFAVRGPEASVWLSGSGLSFRLSPAKAAETRNGASSWVIALDLVGATPRQPTGEDPLPTKVSYFKGPKENWRTGLPAWGSVRYREPWPGVDMLVSGTVGELESTFVVRPGADPELIHLAYRGATSVRLELDGSLLVDTPFGEIREQAPFAYQEIDGQRVQVESAFEMVKVLVEPGLTSYRFRLGDYDPAHELVIDPVTLIYCGYIGGSGADYPNGVAVDASGSAYITGNTYSSEATFPLTVGPDMTHNGGGDVFVAKVDNAGATLAYCGYIGGSGTDSVQDIAVDTAGNAYIVGNTESDESTFPVTVGPDLSYNGGPDRYDAFVAKVNAAGTALDYCGYIGGSDWDSANGIAVDDLGYAYVAGHTASGDDTFPVTIGPDLTYNGGYNDAFVARVNLAGTALDYCGYVGGSSDDVGGDIAVDGAGNAYVSGLTSSTEATFPVAIGPDLTHNGHYDAFVAKVDVAAALSYCGYIGGSFGDWSSGIAVDATGNAYIAGTTQSADFPLTGEPFGVCLGGVDTFVAKASPDGAFLAYCGCISGTDVDWSGNLAVDTAGNAYVTGYTTSDVDEGFPVTVGPDLSYNGGYDAFVAKVNGVGSALGYCGYIGGTSDEDGTRIAVDAFGSAYVVGRTLSTEATFPVTVGPDLTHNGAGDTFVAKISPLLPGVFGKVGPANGASGQVTNLALSWGESADATSYEYCIDPTANSACDSVWTSSGAATNASITGLDYETTYSWQVRAVNTGGSTEADGGTWWQFTTEDVPLPGAFDKSAPTNGATGQLLSLTLSWGESADATSYEYCIDTSANESCDGPWVSVALVTSTPVFGLIEWTTYSWQVRAVNTQGVIEADCGSWWWFITTPLLFTDGFESGDISAWSAAVP